MKKFLTAFSIAALILLAVSCRPPDNFGFYQPVLLNTTVPDGPPEYKAGWHDGCKSALSVRYSFQNSWAHAENLSGKGIRAPDMGSGIYQHDPMYQTAWGQAWFACFVTVDEFVQKPSMQFHPLN